MHSGIGQGYFQSTPIQLCLMTAQIANGGYKIKPRIIFDKRNNDLRDYIKHKNEKPNESLPAEFIIKKFQFKTIISKSKKI